MQSAIACQGGGSHAAFAAGVLSELLSPSYVDRFELVGLSGTSGGAISAALAWAGLISGGPEEARKRLLGMWRDLEVHDLFDEMTNFWLVNLASSPITEEISPYAYYPVAAKALKTLLERRSGDPAPPCSWAHVKYSRVSAQYLKARI